MQKRLKIMKSKSMQFFIPTAQKPLEKFLESIGMDVLHDDDARIVYSDGRVYPFKNQIDPVALRDSLQKSGIPVREYLVISQETELQHHAKANSPYILRCQSLKRFAQYGIDATLPYQQLVNLTGTSSVVLEECTDGTAVWFFGFVLNGEFVHHGTVQIEWMSDVLQFPMSLSISTENEGEHFGYLSQEVVQSLSLADGPVRIEIIGNRDNNDFAVSEVDTSWFDSALPVDLFSVSGQGAYWENQIRLLQGEALLPPTPVSQAVSLQWLSSRSGIVEEIVGVEDAVEMLGIYTVELCVEVGTRLGHVLHTESRNEIGYVVATGKILRNAQSAAAEAGKCIHIRRKQYLIKDYHVSNVI
jgi:hypothetical protein